MEKNENKPTWEELLNDEKVYMPDSKFTKAYNKTMRYIINKTNLQTAMFYYVLYSHYKGTSKSCFPELSTLSKECGVSIKTIQKMIKVLKENKIIDYTSGKQGKCNSYTFPLETKHSKAKPTPKNNNYNDVRNCFFDISDEQDLF